MEYVADVGDDHDNDGRGAGGDTDNDDVLVINLDSRQRRTSVPVTAGVAIGHQLVGGGRERNECCDYLSEDPGNHLAARKELSGRLLNNAYKMMAAKVAGEVVKARPICMYPH